MKAFVEVTRIEPTADAMNDFTAAAAMTVINYVEVMSVQSMKSRRLTVTMINDVRSDTGALFSDDLLRTRRHWRAVSCQTIELMCCSNKRIQLETCSPDVLQSPTTSCCTCSQSILADCSTKQMCCAVDILCVCVCGNFSTTRPILSLSCHHCQPFERPAFLLLLLWLLRLLYQSNRNPMFAS